MIMTIGTKEGCAKTIREVAQTMMDIADKIGVGNYNPDYMKSGFKHGAYLFLNTPEIREKLEKLGYKKKNRFGVEGGPCIFTYPHYRKDCPNEIYPHYTECTEEYFKSSFDWCADRINCGTDINKFYAVISERN